MEKLLAITKALSDANRLRVLMALTERPHLCACHLTEMLGVTGATVSRHMGLLRQAGLVKARKCGKWTHYTLCTGNVQIDTLLSWVQLHMPENEVIRADREFIRSCVLEKMECEEGCCG
ncbi:metalloregulator ArsR/SmtB family transcription factor [Desulfobotulus sp. H1]|uniref:Metalloregulator ArsR/SmtB family transcription factor n=1 Tax=Desulfobotulus pelophilus TaxID=2823377 RepID=A0ABT3NC42_9BACT|nr:metalloregulator ArsR/SmtB family transcription factor [Desulfobotulus pelophilus]MCW7755038.1 metalloregulator ArsR/SmtB family transcription factor [Desulfobotulus pelophilus]